MKRFIIIVLVLLSCFIAIEAIAGISAGNLTEFNDLTDSQKAQVVSQIAALKEQSTPKPSDVNEWVNIGMSIGKGIAATAAELGVSVDKFIGTTTGKIAMALIVWHVVGNDIMHMAAGFIFFITFIPIWFYMNRRYCVIKSITKSEGKGKVVEYYTDDDDIGETRGGLLVVLLVIVIANAIILFG